MRVIREYPGIAQGFHEVMDLLVLPVGGDLSDEIDEVPRAYNRALKLVRTIDKAHGGDDTDALIKDIEAKTTYADSFAACESFGIFVNSDTLEPDLFNGGFAAEMTATLREAKFSKKRQDFLDAASVAPRASPIRTRTSDSWDASKSRPNGCTCSSWTC